MLIDSHCHLNFPHFEGILDDVITRAKEMDVTYMQTICTKMSEFQAILAIAEQYPNIWCSVGVHPNHVEEEALVTAQQLVSCAQHNKVIGLGETGLDYYRDSSDRKKQQQSFIEHIKASRQTGLPVIVHTREADEDTIAILKEQMQEGVFPGLIHCFTSSHWLAEQAIDLGFYISISGIVTFKNAKDLQESVKLIPLERLLVETDAPYLAPMPHRGKTNEPGYTKHTAEFIAQLKDVSYEEVANVTTENFRKLFSQAQWM